MPNETQSSGLAAEPAQVADSPKSFEERLKCDVQSIFPFAEGESYQNWFVRAHQQHHGRRAVLAARMWAIDREMRGERASSKRAWIASARLLFEPRPREARFVCGKFKSITQAHHLVPLAKQFDRGLETASHAHEFLCPNHHAILHLWIDGDISIERRQRRGAPTLDDLDDHEYQRMMDLMGHC
jgi:hypothetical protein